MRAFKRKIRARDSLAPKALSLFHYYNDFKQKTTFGGFLSTLIELYILIVVFTNLKNLLWRDDPYIATMEDPLESPE